MIKSLFIAVAVLIGIGLLLLVFGFPGNMILGIWGIAGVFGVIFLAIWFALKLFSKTQKSKSKKSSSKATKKTPVKRK